MPKVPVTPPHNRHATQSALRIGALSTATGVEVETIRFYEREGLLMPPARSDNGYRAYGAEHLERLSFDQLVHVGAVSMRPVCESQKTANVVERHVQRPTVADDAQLARVRARLRSLRALDKQLAALRSRCDSAHHSGPCGILQELVAAAHGEACACHSDANSITSNIVVAKAMRQGRKAIRRKPV